MDWDSIMFKNELYITLVQLKCIANRAAPGLLFVETKPAMQALPIVRFHNNVILQMGNPDLIISRG